MHPSNPSHFYKFLLFLHNLTLLSAHSFRYSNNNDNANDKYANRMATNKIKSCRSVHLSWVVLLLLLLLSIIFSSWLVLSRKHIAYEWISNIITRFSAQHPQLHMQMQIHTKATNWWVEGDFISWSAQWTGKFLCDPRWFESSNDNDKRILWFSQFWWNR